MADNKLTLRPKASLESKFSSAFSSAFTTNHEPTNTEDDAITTPTHEKGDFLKGVKRGIRRLGSVSHPARNRPGDIDTSTPNPHLATAIQEVPEDDRPSTSHTSIEILSNSTYCAPAQTIRDRSISKSRENPLPLAPISPPIADLLKSP